MAATIQLRRGTASQWTSANPILAAGELGLETDTLKLKAGNGSTAWNSLSYIGTEGDITAVVAGTGLTGGATSGSATVALDTTSAYVVPTQTGNSGKFLTTNGTASSWAATVVPADYSAKGTLLVGTGTGTYTTQTVGTNGQVLQADSTQADGVKWATVDALPSQTGNSGKYLTTNGTSASWVAVAVDPNPQIFMLGGM